MVLSGKMLAQHVSMSDPFEGRFFLIWISFMCVYPTQVLGNARVTFLGCV